MWSFVCADALQEAVLFPYAGGSGVGGSGGSAGSANDPRSDGGGSGRELSEADSIAMFQAPLVERAMRGQLAGGVHLLRTLCAMSAQRVGLVLLVACTTELCIQAAVVVLGCLAVPS